MAVFKDTQHLYEVLGDLWNYCIKETELGPKLKEFEVSVKFVITEPQGLMHVTHDTVLTGDAANKDATLTIESSGDAAHKFWLKQMTLPVALATRKMKSKGPVPKMLRLLPYLKPVFEKYPQYCEKYGLSIE